MFWNARYPVTLIDPRIKSASPSTSAPSIVSRPDVLREDAVSCLLGAKSKTMVSSSEFAAESKIASCSEPGPDQDP
ncbi:MAG: hypothetical protein ABW063_02065, partial [Caulobacter sp.]